MKRGVYILLLITFFGCKNKEEKITQEKLVSTESLMPEKRFDSLLIEGNNIWIRDTPKKGKVIMKLNQGDRGVILDTSEVDTIRGYVDYWYQIKHKDAVGWVFGSQTNIKSDESKQVDLFLKQNLDKLQCRKINFRFIKEVGSKHLSKIIVLSDSIIIDTVQIQKNRVDPLKVDDFRIRKEDYNFDNLCDFIIEDIMTVYDGNMKRYYYIFDLETKKFREVKSLQNWIGDVEVDQINKKVTLYCAYKECRVSYKFIDGNFKIVEGEYPEEPE